MKKNPDRDALQDIEHSVVYINIITQVFKNRVTVSKLWHNCR